MKPCEGFKSASAQKKASIRGRIRSWREAVYYTGEVQQVNFTTLDFALQCREQGIVTFPVRIDTKEAAVAWKRLKGPVDEHKLRDWFDMTDDHFGIAVKCGDASGGLVVRDFDDPVEMDTWNRSHSDLISRLPTSRTPSHGQHVYFRSPGVGLKSLDGADGHLGELRGNGAYVVAPPTQGYEWLTPLRGDIPTLDPSEFLPTSTATTDFTLQHVVSGLAAAFRASPDGPEQTDKTESYHVILLPVDSLGIEEQALRIAEKHVPVKVRTRDRSLFELARELKTVISESNVDLLKKSVAHWFDRTLPGLRPESSHRTFEANWVDFQHKFRSAKVPASGSIKVFSEAARTIPTPACIRHIHGNLLLLAKLCIVLTVHHGGPFFLPGELAGEFVGGNQRYGSRLLRDLQGLGVIKRVTNHWLKGSKALKYEWTGGALV